jgi:hypothetical protein
LDRKDSVLHVTNHARLEFGREITGRLIQHLVSSRRKGYAELSVCQRGRGVLNRGCNSFILAKNSEGGCLGDV